MKDLAADLAEKGYVRVKALTATETTFALARRLGLVSVVPGISPVQRLVPRVVEQFSPTSYSGIYGHGKFPLHTDMAHWYVPPHFILLRCVHPTPEVETLVLHSQHLLGSEDPLTLRRALFRPRRRLDGRLTCLRLQETGRCRWDPLFIVPINKIAVEVRERVVQRIETARIEKLSLETPIDCIILDNWSVLHGRTEVPSGCLGRKLERVYLDSVHL